MCFGLLQVVSYLVVSMYSRGVMSETDNHVRSSVTFLLPAIRILQYPVPKVPGL
jgi:hypothetical protein